MALEVLSGPSPVTLLGSPMAGVSGGNAAAWIQGLGLLASGSDGGLGAMYAIELDGTAHRRSDFNATPNLALNLPAGYQRGLARIGTTSIFAFDWLTAQQGLTPLYSRTGANYGQIHVICADRFLQFNGTTVSSSPLTDGAAFAPEYTWPGSDSGSNVSLSPVSDRIVCVCFGSSGQIRFYDVIAKAQVGPIRYLSETCAGAWYVAKHGIFVELIGLDLKIRADATRPAHLTNPAALTAIAAGYASTVEVVATGDAGEPCIGELINWSITAGAGALSASQTATDETGTAQVEYSAPVAATGSVSISATLDF